MTNKKQPIAKPNKDLTIAVHNGSKPDKINITKGNNQQHKAAKT